MLATSMRQPSSPASSQRRTIESSPGDEAAAQPVGTKVELGQRAEPEPADVVVGMGVEVVEARLGRGVVGTGRGEPLVVASRVVGGEVADHAHAAGVGLASTSVASAASPPRIGST